MAPVEARSLASLITLASNPPQYPRNPTEEAQEPLVLYIARVPGSKDIFLTTMKPRQKVVTAEDVSSCLYFLHSEQASDGEFIREIQHIRHQRHQSDTQPVVNENTVPRKPLAVHPLSSSASPNAESLLTGNKAHWHVGLNEQHHAAHIERKPVGGTSPSKKIGSIRDGQPQSVPPRGSIGPLSNHSLGQSPKRKGYAQPQDSKPASTTETLRVSVSAPHPEAYSSYSHVSPSAHQSSTNNGQQGCSKHHEIPRSVENHGRHNFANITITLIRRDPGTGAQWNVGIISNGFGTIEPSVGAASDPNSTSLADMGNEINLEIRTPGYNRFMGQHATHGCDSAGQVPQNGDYLRAEQSPALPARVLQTEKTQNTKNFRRKLVTEDTRFWDRGRRSSRPGSSDFSDGNGETKITKQWKRSTDSHDYDPMLLANEHSAVRRQSLAPKPRGYVFFSPWGGRCEFSTGRGGRALKCKHSLPATSSGTSQLSSVTVSELRFNLPSSTATNTSSNRAGRRVSMSREAKRSSIFRKHLPSDHIPRPRSGFERASQSPDDRDSQDKLDTLDLSLGQENAGGGYGGKKAKLGKLIIEGEGLKMLDLVIAANMGIWWKAYQRVQEDVG